MNVRVRYCSRINYVCIRVQNTTTSSENLNGHKLNEFSTGGWVRGGGRKSTLTKIRIPGNFIMFPANTIFVCL